MSGSLKTKGAALSCSKYPTDGRDAWMMVIY